MEKRLKIAHKLLSDKGVIFLSLDDNEQAILKVLMDDIFGEQNFILSMPRITKKSGKTTDSFAKNHDYVLVYVKQRHDIFVMEEHTDPAFSYTDEYVSERGKYKLNQTLDYDSLSYSASLDYPLEVEGEVFYPGSDKRLWEERQKGKHRRADWAWRWNKKLFDYGYRNGFVVIKRKPDGSARIYTKTYLNAKIEKDSNGEYYINYIQRTKPMSSIDLTDNLYSNDNAKKNLALFGLKDDFDYSKPVELIKRLLKTYSDKNAIILDFFAGSGTTAQAVLELNQQDGGKRKFILCTNNQSGICEKITYKRCKSVIETYDFESVRRVVIIEHKIKLSDFKDKATIINEIETSKKEYRNEYDKFSTEIKGEYLYLYGIKIINKMSGIPANLKYFKTDFVDKDSEELSDELLEHIAEMIELEHGIKIDNKKYVMILTDEEMDEFERNITSYTDLKAVFVNQDILLSATQQKLLDSINSYIIPDYYFDFELREAGELW